MMLNRANRYHSDFTHDLPFMVTVLLVSGLYLPYMAMSVGVWNAIVRLMSLCAFTMHGSECQGMKLMKEIAGRIPLTLLAITLFCY